MTSSMAAVFIVSLWAGLPGEEAYLKGDAASREGRHGDAVEAFAECFGQGGPLASYARVRQAMSRAAGGDQDGGIASLKLVVEEAPDAPWALFARAELARLLQSSQRPGGAVQEWKTLLALGTKPSWLDRYQWNLAECLVASPEAASSGLDLYASLLDKSRPRREKVEASTRLALSPDPEHRFQALEALLNHNENQAATALVLWLRLIGALQPGDNARARYLEGRYLLGSGSVDQGRAMLAEVAAKHPDTVWGRRALAWHTRHLLAEKDPAPGLAMLDNFATAYAGSEELADALWWWASRLSSGGKLKEASEAYRRFVTACPDDARGASALLEAGHALREAKATREAAEVFTSLPEKYPSSPLVPEAWYYAGTLTEDAKALEKAAQGPLGDFFAHRALARLTDEARSSVTVSDGPKVHVPPGTAYLQARPWDKPYPEPFPEGWAEEPWYQRLRFFGREGLEEAEWEALPLVQDFATNAQAPQLLRALSEQGLSATVMRLVASGKWGEAEQGMTPERIWLEYPRAYWPLALDAARETNLDPLLILAIARQESLFQARVVSSAGATGVMQLMPSTAKWLSEVETGITPEEAAHMEHPENSLRMGAHYMRRMLRQWDGNLALAVASYNAGPGNVQKWRKSYPGTNWDAFMDAIRFDETQGFVRKVLGNYAAYLALYGGTADGS